jgi:hypothetical protein
MTPDVRFDRKLIHMRLLSVIAILGLGVAMSSCSKRPAEQQTFTTPEAAVEAMFHALSKGDTTALHALLGPDAPEVMNRADPVQAARDRQVVAAAMVERWWIEGEGPTRTVVVGNEDYPLPIPLVQGKGRWRFDTAAGKEEMLYRRIGRNELAVMDVAGAFVEAQHEYAARSHDGVSKGAFAQRVLSEPGRHDGLYWPATPADSAPSPMGELAAKAAAEGYRRQEGPTPFHGYFFKVLTSQGPSAPGGERSWIVGNRMTGGFALLAWPADYGKSGVMTFLIGPDGELRQQDLGTDTGARAEAINAFDPDSSWSTP